MARETSAAATAPTTVIEERSYQCPLCRVAGKLSATLRSDGRWRYRCRSKTCLSKAGNDQRRWFDRFAFTLEATYEELYVNPEPWLVQFRSGGVSKRGSYSASATVDPLPFDEQFATFRRRVRLVPAHRDYLMGVRGFSEWTVRTAEVGFAEAGELRGVIDGNRPAYVFPVRDASGELVNVMRRFPDGGRPKWSGLWGRPRALYPGPPTTDTVVIAEGPPDPLVLRQNGFDGVGVTHGCPTTWTEEWLAHIKGKLCAVCYDADATENAVKLAEHLGANGARDAFHIDMGRLPELKDIEKGDISDYFNAGRTAEDFRAVLNTAYREHRAERRKARGRQ